ncbi:MAG: hypothetical protein A2293_15800 [Elusimicrobia bacterium RIFOXYB2_FULL_49_7]|nr:MAG: hypothetical protein A2293_15800 [Elusimicrobia bacterium RIFOXYB2_FULL_49_7]
MLTEIEEENGRPYFLWDDQLTWHQLRHILNMPNHPQFAYYLGKTLREANYGDVWRLVSLQTVLSHFKEASPFLGRQRNFWLFLIHNWKQLNLIS